MKRPPERISSISQCTPEFSLSLFHFRIWHVIFASTCCHQSEHCSKSQQNRVKPPPSPIAFSITKGFVSFRPPMCISPTGIDRAKDSSIIFIYITCPTPILPPPKITLAKNRNFSPTPMFISKIDWPMLIPQNFERLSCLRKRNRYLLVFIIDGPDIELPNISVDLQLINMLAVPPYALSHRRTLKAG